MSTRQTSVNETIIDPHETNDDFVIDLEQIRHMCRYYSVSDGFHLTEGLSIIHLNVRSLKNKFDTFQTFLVNTGVEWSIVCVSETWLKPDLLKYFNMNNYELFASCRLSGEGGGTAVYVHNSLQVNQNNLLASLNAENTWVEIEFKQSNKNIKVIIGCLYKPPSLSHSLFVEYLSHVLDTIEKENKFVILAGDFNYNLINSSTDNNVISFCNLLSSHGFISTISKPTRIINGSSTLLDNIFVNNHEYLKQSGVFQEDISDHFPIFNLFSIKQCRSIHNEIKKCFDFNKIHDLKDFLVNNLHDFQLYTDPNEACEKLLTVYMNGIDKFSKLIKPSRRKTPYKPGLEKSRLKLNLYQPVVFISFSHF